MSSLAGFEAVKLVVVGQGGVGKSAFTIRFATNLFCDEYDPTIEDSYRKEVVMDGKKIVLDILDTAGPEEFTGMQEAWIRSAEGLIYCFSLVDASTFTYLDHLYEMHKRTNPTCVLTLVGTKLDLVYNPDPVLEQFNREKQHYGEYKKLENYYTSILSSSCNLLDDLISLVVEFLKIEDQSSLRRKITEQEIEEKAKKWNVNYYEISAKGHAQYVEENETKTNDGPDFSYSSENPNYRVDYKQQNGPKTEEAINVRRVIVETAKAVLARPPPPRRKKPCLIS